MSFGVSGFTQRHFYQPRWTGITDDCGLQHWSGPGSDGYRPDDGLCAEFHGTCVRPGEAMEDPAGVFFAHRGWPGSCHCGSSLSECWNSSDPAFRVEVRA